MSHSRSARQPSMIRRALVIAALIGGVYLAAAFALAAYTLATLATPDPSPTPATVTTAVPCPPRPPASSPVGGYEPTPASADAWEGC